MTTILIDDEKLAVSRLKRLLTEYGDTIEIIGEAHNGIEGLETIERLKPELIFLDIEMPGMNGFEMLSNLSYSPLVVFATAYDEYAIRAFEENSIDYLLKPIEKERLEITIQKLKKNKTHPILGFDNVQLLKILEQIKPKKEMVSISVKTGDKILLLRLEDISYFEAEDKYIFLNTKDGKKYLSDYTIANLEEKLPDNFLRISRSKIVNSHLIKEIQKHFSGKYILFLNDKENSKIETGLKFSDNIKNLFQL